MKNELKMPTEISIKDKKNTFNGTIVRAALMANNKVIHVRTADAEDFYLLYYKKSLIFGDKLVTVPEGSFIDLAFRNGLIVESSNPILFTIIPKQMVTIPNRNKLFSLLQDHFSPLEIAYITASLDSFFEKSILAKAIEQIYFHHKRNGQFFKAYQILQVLTNFMPELKSAKEWISSREFNSAVEFYRSSSLSAIIKKDPLYAAQYCFKNRSNPDMYLILEEMLISKESYPELILLWLEKIKKLQNTDEIEIYTKFALKFLTLENWILILGEENINPFYVLPEAKKMIEGMIEKGNYEAAAVSLLPFMDDIPLTFDPILKKIWENVDAEFVELHLEHFITILQRQGYEGNRKQSEEQIYHLIVTMMKDFDLKTVYEKLLPLQKVLPHSLLFRKLSIMVKLQEDPDRMMELGDYYAEFKQYDPAIDCYSWEMELKPQDPDPVWKICKMYQQKGMTNEAAAYQKVFSQLKDIQESI